jgi:hypothetical protein
MSQSQTSIGQRNRRVEVKGIVGGLGEGPYRISEATT